MNIKVKNITLIVSFHFGKNLSICIKDSYQIKYSEDIEDALKEIMNRPEFQAFAKEGYTRSLASMRREWEAHNLLYRLGILKSRTGSSDLDQRESFIRRAGYVVLSFIYRLFGGKKKK